MAEERGKDNRKNKVTDTGGADPDGRDGEAHLNGDEQRVPDFWRSGGD